MASDAQLDPFPGQAHGIGPVIGLVLGVVDRGLAAPKQAAGAPVDLDGDPMAFRVLADDEPGRVRGGALGMDGGDLDRGDLDGGRHRVSGVRAGFRRPRPLSAPGRVRVRAGSGANPISVSLGFRSSAVRTLEIRRRVGHLGAMAGRPGEFGEQA